MAALRPRTRGRFNLGTTSVEDEVSPAGSVEVESVDGREGVAETGGFRFGVRMPLGLLCLEMDVLLP